MFDICYNPQAPFNPKGVHRLDKKDNRADAIAAAEEYSKLYYGEISPVWVMEGRKKIHSIPTRANRVNCD